MTDDERGAVQRRDAVERFASVRVIIREPRIGDASGETVASGFPNADPEIRETGDLRLPRPRAAADAV